jgi:hypothetical protein
MTTHNAHPYGLAILCEDAGAPEYNTLAVLALNYGITKILVLSREELPPPSHESIVHLQAPPTAECAALHGQACDHLIVTRPDTPIPEVIEALQAAKRGNPHPLIRRIAAPLESAPAAWTAGQPIRLLGVTIITPAYQKVGQEAVRRWHQFTGQPCIELSAPNDTAAFRLKLLLPTFLPAVNVCYFDADLWLLRPLDIDSLLPKVEAFGLLAVRDPGIADPTGFVARDCQEQELDPLHYCNSGFWVADLSRDRVTHAFEAALTALDTMTWFDYGDQSAWNYGLKKYGLIPHPLPLAYNFFMHGVTHGYIDAIPAQVIGLHAAGVTGHKKHAHLTQYAEALKYAVKPLPKPAPPADPARVTARQFVPPPKALTLAGHGQAIQDAAHTLTEGETFDQRASALCYLTYRCLDGLISFAEWKALRDTAYAARVDIGGECKPIHHRWWISQTTAEYYLHTCVHSVPGFVEEFAGPADPHSLERLFRALESWPPQILNVLRLGVLGMYHHYLTATSSPAAFLIHQKRLLEPWQSVWGKLDLEQWPYRFEESHGDLRALTAMMFILRATGAASFPDQAWCPLDRCANEGYFGKALVAMGKLNPELALWK